MPADLDDLLARTSRTFALTIPLLAEPLRRQVRDAYLLFRIADTVEDAGGLARAVRLRLLGQFRALLGSGVPTEAPACFVAECAAARPVAAPAHAELLAETAAVLADATALDPAPRGAIAAHLGRTVERMMDFVARGDAGGRPALRSVGELKDYCYAVAGIVGEMLTELVLLAEPAVASARDRLRGHAVAFGEGLQLVNILKDSGDDRSEGRVFVPPDVPRTQVFALAEDALAQARRYCGLLHQHGARATTLAFHALPVRLAHATLARVRQAGPGARISRAEVAAELAAMHADLAAGGAGL